MEVESLSELWHSLKAGRSCPSVLSMVRTTQSPIRWLLIQIYGNRTIPLVYCELTFPWSSISCDVSLSVSLQINTEELFWLSFFQSWNAIQSTFSWIISKWAQQKCILIISAIIIIRKLSVNYYTKTLALLFLLDGLRKSASFLSLWK